MKLCWSEKSIPELRGLTSEERRRIWQRANKRSRWRWIMPVIGGLSAGLGSVVAEVVTPGVRSWEESWVWIRMGIVASITAAVMTMAIPFWHNGLRPYIRQEIEAEKESGGEPG